MLTQVIKPARDNEAFGPERIVFGILENVPVNRSVAPAFSGKASECRKEGLFVGWIHMVFDQDHHRTTIRFELA